MAIRELTVTVTGWVGAPPKLYPGQGEHPVPFTQLRVGHTVRELDRHTGELSDGATSWFTVKSFRDLAVNVADCLRTGDPVVVHGRLRVEEWADAEGRISRSAVVLADSIGPDLRWGTTKFSRVARPTAPRSPEAEDAEVEAVLAEHPPADLEATDVDELPTVPLATGS
ncbi:single-stranded DNA-binding protein [Cellulomonas taurus]|jgi:single-strand DNA-binding protein|uniref:single-stranded DNA-binding protein n=1 Tax=Cellulomonas taurus TaxID=2729175 RepID=UPI00145E88A4|nr:single-stranded DNA-binding protein [Cellulomonas taurus]